MKQLFSEMPSHLDRSSEQSPAATPQAEMFPGRGLHAADTETLTEQIVVTTLASSSSVAWKYTESESVALGRGSSLQK